MSFIEENAYKGFSRINSAVNSAANSFGPALLRGPFEGGPLVAGVEVSVVLSEAHNFTASVSSFSLESGAQVCDHVIVNPDDVSIVFSMTNTGGGQETARDVFETFKRMRDERQLLELITEHYVYENMVLTSVSPMHQAPSKGALNFSIKLQQINFVQMERVGREAGSLELDTPTSRTAVGPTNAGQQDAKPINSDSLSATA